MIHHLSGIHETADYRTDTQICLYYNDENENYPPHWHTPFEVIHAGKEYLHRGCREKALCSARRRYSGYLSRHRS